MISEEAQKQLQLLSLLLSIEDLIENKGNYGIAEQQSSKEEAKESLKELRIVDFRVIILIYDLHYAFLWSKIDKLLNFRWTLPLAHESQEQKVT